MVSSDNYVFGELQHANSLPYGRMLRSLAYRSRPNDHKGCCCGSHHIGGFVPNEDVPVLVVYAANRICQVFKRLLRSTVPYKVNELNEQQDGMPGEFIRMDSASVCSLTHKLNHVHAIDLFWLNDLLTHSSHVVLSFKAWALRGQSSY